jgi:hypothetical protein
MNLKPGCVNMSSEIAIAASGTSLLLSPIVILSLILTMGAKVIYDIALALNPLCLAGGIYLATIAGLSILASRFFFEEKPKRTQMDGFVYAAIGLVLLL